MSRKLPEKFSELTAESLKFEKKDDGRVTQTRKYKLITPLFGGGVEAKKADPIKVIRETSIRGQLRFWWRAMRGGGTLKEMKKREDALFGSGGENSAQSKILIFVKEINNGNNVQLNSVPKYAGFPLEAGDTLKDNVTFTLEISFPSSEKDEVEAALWAWETFGGIGGRTRRGFGAICLTNETDSPIQTLEEFTKKVETFFSNGDKLEDQIQSGFPILKGAEAKIIKKDLVEKWKKNTIAEERQIHRNRFGDSRPFNSKLEKLNDYELVWWFFISKLQNFRQSPRTSSNFNGESDWSEPDAIRRLTGNHAIDKRTGVAYRAPSHSVGNKFPRAQFGLPIEFKFKQQDEDAGDPPKITLKVEGRNKDRLASPLILRPIACSDGAVGIALILGIPPLPNVELKGYGTVVTNLNQPDIVLIKPMNDSSTTETDVLKSFLIYLEK